jgi:Mg-chelatase subunit ChlD
MTLLLAFWMNLHFSSALFFDDSSRAANEMLAALKKNDESAICDAMEKLAQFDDAKVAGLLIERGMTHSSLMVHEEALRLARTLKSEDARDRIIQILRRGRKFESRMDAMRVLKSWSHNDSRPELIGRLQDKTDWVVSLAIQFLRDHPHSETVSALIEKLPKTQGRQAGEIVDLLEYLTGEKYPAETAGWKIWWDQNRETWSPAEISEDSEDGEKKDVSTAVRDGLYGEIASERVVFLLDVSGSMLASTAVDDSRIEIAKKQLKRVLQGGLTTKSKFTVVAFSDELTVLSPKLIKAKGASLKKAIDFVDSLEAGGETNSYGALKKAFADREVDTIYVLSDGSPTAGEETSLSLISDAVSQWNRYRGVRIHCIGLFAGTAPNQDEARASEFLKTLARMNFGKYVEIR